MENTGPSKADVQLTADNFEAVIASGDVRLIAQSGDTRLYIHQDGLEYIYDGSRAHHEGSEDFARLKAEYFTSAG